MWPPVLEETQPIERPTREETPDLFLEPPLPDSQGPDSAHLLSCYTCGRSFQGVPEEYIDRRFYEYLAGKDKWGPGKKTSYVISFCMPCSRLLLPRR